MRAPEPKPMYHWIGGFIPDPDDVSIAIENGQMFLVVGLYSNGRQRKIALYNDQCEILGWKLEETPESKIARLEWKIAQLEAGNAQTG